MKRTILPILISVALFAALTTATSAQPAITEQEARAIGVDAYLYFYPLVTMDLTRKQLTNIEPGLSQNYSPPKVTIDPSVDMKTPPKVQVDTMPAEKYFAYVAELLKVIPPHITDQPMIAQLKKIGFEPGKSFDLDKADPAIRKALESAPEDARQLMAWKVPTLARVVNGWSITPIRWASTASTI